jgi:hypothetical protein
MSEINDFSKQFLADFIAARLRALRIEKGALRRDVEDQGLASPRNEGDPMNMPTNQDRSLNSLRRFYL